jgi:hypothetical protein
MALKIETVQIDGSTYQIEQLPTSEALQVYTALGESGIPLLSLFAQAINGPAEEAQVKLGLLAFRLVATLSLENKQMLAELFAKRTKLKGKAGDADILVDFKVGGEMYEHHFATMGRWTRWVIACMKMSFADFLPDGASTSGDGAAGLAKDAAA